MTCHKEYFSSLCTYDGEKDVIYTANDGECAIKGIGTIPITLSSNRNINSRDVLYNVIPSITKKLFSVSQMLDKGLDVEFCDYACLIKKNDVVVARGKRQGKLFKLDANVNAKEVACMMNVQISK